MLCSFQRPEPWQPIHQWTMPQVPSPEQCEDEEAVYVRAIQNFKSNPKVMRVLQERLTVSTIATVPWRSVIIDDIIIIGTFQESHCYQVCKGTSRQSGRHHQIHVLDESPRYTQIRSSFPKGELEFTSFSSTCDSKFYLFSAFLPIYLTCVCMSRFINSLGCLHEKNYSISTAPLVMGLQSGNQDASGLSMVVCLSSIIVDGRMWLICIDSPPSIILSGIIGKAPFYLSRTLLLIWFFF